MHCSPLADLRILDIFKHTQLKGEEGIPPTLSVPGLRPRLIASPQLRHKPMIRFNQRTISPFCSLVLPVPHQQSGRQYGVAYAGVWWVQSIQTICYVNMRPDIRKQKTLWFSALCGATQIGFPIEPEPKGSVSSCVAPLDD